MMVDLFVVGSYGAGGLVGDRLGMNEEGIVWGRMITIGDRRRFDA
ncbi:hypothetical protein CCUG63695_03608 [Mycobacteroides franklinii]|uniref:Uncharacterized protein n=1 Tax=Mycobacteroides franklinii TaxID=948102 RepID=A0A4R8R7K4_9MYCO|nr:hypothetical protein CCUG64054_03681 [Mycobacteroides franklinii]TDZ50758.1 hypothetical protein CCUG63697_02267 [Mycobacteroides franklinii]TDZ57178.1 hypothetical protein CCUG63696_03683 [Mycobacteroides franklinii]TDZ64119.1 hypothetical protein CCUG63695_03608 [Mycobacteroides franklinii]TDZ70516.1 hypothetical protein CCUG64056_03681 [Mycobacteroides franklinii]